MKLTVVHDELDHTTAAMISRGWPRVLSDLKTLLETGEPLPPNPEPTVSASLRATTS